MKKLIHNKNILPVLVIVSGVLFVVSQATILVILEPLGLSALNFQFSFDGKSLADIIAAWGSGGTAIFREHFYMDFLHPVVYSSFLFLLLCYLRLKLPGSEYSRDIPPWFLLPFTAAAIDLGENFLELNILARYPDIPDGIAFANGLVSSLKWGAAAVNLGIIALLAVRAAAHSLNKSR